MLEKTKKYILLHKKEILLILLILFVAAFFRLYKISDYMTFLGDEGRDAIVAKDILHGKLTLLGPRASAGDFFLGPAYYYMIAPFLLLTNYDPVGPAIMVAIFGVATVALIYFVGKDFFGTKAALIACSLYSISPLVITYSRSSWNPNLMPFFSLLLLYLIYLSVKRHSDKLFFICGLIFGITIQLHYLTVFLGVIIFFYILIGEFLENRKSLITRYAKHALELLLGFIISISPFILFELKHGFPNTVTIFNFIFTDNTSQNYSVGQSFLGNVSDVIFRLFGRLVTNLPPQEKLLLDQSIETKFWQIATVVLIIFTIGALIKVKDKLKLLLASFWLLFGVMLFGFYKKPIYDYYLGFMFPLPFLLVGNFLSQTADRKKFKGLSIIISTIVFISLILINLTTAPFLSPANRQKQQAKNIADFVISKTENQPYNFALLTRGNSDHVYRYFLETENHPPVTIENMINDPQRKTVTNQLIVICEYLDCQPLGNALWEVSGFGRAEIVGVWEVPYVKIYKLKHYVELAQ